jgi:hypothetical protein
MDATPRGVSSKVSNTSAIGRPSDFSISARASPTRGIHTCSARARTHTHSTWTGNSTCECGSTVHTQKSTNSELGTLHSSAGWMRGRSCAGVGGWGRAGWTRAMRAAELAAGVWMGACSRVGPRRVGEDGVHTRGELGGDLVLHALAERHVLRRHELVPRGHGLGLLQVEAWGAGERWWGRARVGGGGVTQQPSAHDGRVPEAALPDPNEAARSPAAPIAWKHSAADLSAAG